MTSPIGPTIRRLRRNRGITGTAMAAAAGLGYAAVLKLERSKDNAPTLRTLSAIAVVLNMPVSELMREWETDAVIRFCCGDTRQSVRKDR